MNPSLYHKFLVISIIPAGLNPMEANKSDCTMCPQCLSLAPALWIEQLFPDE
jgi:hypothetical protein